MAPGTWHLALGASELGALSRVTGGFCGGFRRFMHSTRLVEAKDLINDWSGGAYSPWHLAFGSFDPVGLEASELAALSLTGCETYTEDQVVGVLRGILVVTGLLWRIPETYALDAFKIFEGSDQ
ncbi:hypothetical protein KM043_001262 [Ampulex compressa]|nr:hypothetical protein KM043_001262 [Ampulex compressa]